MNRYPRINHYLLGVLFFAGLCSNSAIAQGWVKEYYIPAADISSYSEGFSIIEASNNDLIIAGYHGDTASISPTGSSALVRLTPNGDTVWVRKILDASRFWHVTNTADSGFVTVGSDTVSVGMAAGVVMTKVDAAGIIQWVKRYGAADGVTPLSVELTDDGGFFVCGYTALPNAKAYALKTDAIGDSVWAATYSQPTPTLLPTNGIQTSDGGYMLFTRRGASDTTHLIKTDAVGDTMWTRTYYSDVIYQLAYGISTSDGGYALVGAGLDAQGLNIGSQVAKLDAAGDTLWTSFFHSPQPATVWEVPRHISETADGGFLVTGSDEWSVVHPTRLFCARVDPQGSVDFINFFGEDVHLQGTLCEGLTMGTQGIQTSDGGYAVVGVRSNPYACGTAMYVVKVDSLGNAYSNQINGEIYEDDNVSCTKDAGEAMLANRIVRAAGLDTFYTVCDSLGYYEMTVGIGTYTIAYGSPVNFWDPSACSPTVKTASFPVAYDTVTVDFPEERVYDCPYMHVDVSTPLLRICQPTIYTVTYSNLGSSDAVNSYVEVTMDPHLVVDSASVPWNMPQVGNLYTFDLGTVTPGENGMFSIYIDLPCDSTILGQTHCVEAYIYPDTICGVLTGNWDGSELKASAWCDLDTVRLQVENIGSGAMSAPRSYHVTEDNIIGQPQPIQLGPGQVHTVSVAANGSTWGIHAEQAPEYPGFYITYASVEGCVATPGDTFTIGIKTTLPEDDLAPFKSIDCQQSIGPYDPNDKRVYPTGTEAAHYIHDSTSLEYHIRFQNTGTDTAFTVVIRDTISPYLDPFTIVPGAASHSYSFNLVGNGIAQFTFSNIMLPDSFVNEPASHGFIKFRIDQRENNPVGTVIENSADIYFDYNAPIITNTAFNTIGSSSMFFNVDELEENNVLLTVFPNPFQTVATVKVDGSTQGDLVLEVYSMTGQLVKTVHESQANVIEFQRDGLLAGVYLLRLRSGDMLLGTGKLIAE